MGRPQPAGPSSPLPPAIVNKVLLEHSHSHSFSYCLWPYVCATVAEGPSSWQRLFGPPKPKIFIAWPLQKMFANPCFARTFRQIFYMEMERLIWIAPLSFLFSDNSIPFQGNRMASRIAITRSAVLLPLLVRLLSTIVWLSRDYEPI